MAKSKRRNKHTADEAKLAQSLGIEVEGGDIEDIEPNSHPEDSQPEDSQPEAQSQPEDNQPEATDEPATDLDTLIEQMIANEKDENMKKILREQLNKVYGEQRTKANQSKWQAFDSEFKEAVEKLISELLAKHGLKAEKQQIIITFPDGETNYSRGLEGKGRKAKDGSNGKRSGFPTKWGKAEDTDGVEYSSPSVMADKLGCLVNGKGAGYADMVDVFDKQGHEVVELPKGAKLDELIAKQTDPDRKERLASLAGDVFKVKA